MKLFDEIPYLTDDRIILREMTDQDAEALRRLSHNMRVYRYLPAFLYEQKYEDPHDVIRNMRRECIETKESILLGIFLKADPETMTGIAEIYAWEEDRNKASIGVRLDER